MAKTKSLSPFGPKRLSWYAVLAAAAFVCFGVQLDFAVEENAALSRAVPAPFRGMALTVDADRALDSEATGSAEEATQRLLMARPIPAENLSRRALSSALSGDESAASDAILASARRGWRDPLAQMAVMQAAIDTDDWALVAQRLTAMRKLNYPREVTDGPLAQLAIEPQGRNALQEQLLADPEWFRQFSRTAPEFMDPASFVQLFGATIEAREADDCLARLAATNKFIDRGENNAVASLWSGSCTDKMADGREPAAFANVADNASAGPFGWRLPSRAGLRRKVQSGDQGNVISFVNSERIDQLLAFRSLMLAPGNYDFVIDSVMERGSVTGRLDKNPAISVTCRDQSRSVARQAGDTNQWRVSIPTEGCRFQTMQIVVPSGRGEVRSVSFGDS